MFVRGLTPADAERYRSLRNRALDQATWAIGSSVSHEQAVVRDDVVERLRWADEQAIFGALQENTLLGMAGCVATDAIKRICGASQINLTVAVTKEPAINLYRSPSFDEVARESSSNLDGDSADDQLHMGLRWAAHNPNRSDALEPANRPTKIGQSPDIARRMRNIT
ncbi:acetyltransferase [Caballeronia jiangsuensis]|nr:acetyltransferase [Caballeronia jiangsuensis]